MQLRMSGSRDRCQVDLKSMYMVGSRQCVRVRRRVERKPTLPLLSPSEVQQALWDLATDGRLASFPGSPASFEAAVRIALWSGANIDSLDEDGFPRGSWRRSLLIMIGSCRCGKDLESNLNRRTGAPPTPRSFLTLGFGFGFQ